MFGLRSKITKTVLLYFFTNPHLKAYVNQLARTLDLDSGNLSRKLIELEKSGILLSKWEGDQRYYFINESFPLKNEYKKLILQSTGIDTLLKNTLIKFPGIKRAFIYGSYAKGQFDAQSDIDFFVIGNCDELQLQEKLSAIEKKIGRDINTTNITEKEFNNKSQKDPFLKNILSNPIIEVLQ